MKAIPNSNAAVTDQPERARTNPRMKTVTAALVAVLSAGAMLPLAARADGDSDRQRNTVFYQKLDRWEEAPTPAVTASVRAGNDSRPDHALARVSSRRSARRRHPAHVAFIHPVHAAPSRVIITAPAEPEKDDGYFVSYPMAEVTGAAGGQTVNRAINNLL